MNLKSKQALTRRRNAAVRYAVLNAALTTGWLAGWAVATGTLCWWVLLASMAQVLPLALNSATALTAQQDLNSRNYGPVRRLHAAVPEVSTSKKNAGG